MEAKTKSVLLVDDYRDVLRAEFSRRRHADARYSLRGFAKDLGLSPSRLSEVLSGKQGLSAAVASRIAVRVGLNRDEKSYFCDLIEAEHARSSEARLMAKRRLEERDTDRGYLTLKADTFQAVSEWYHYAIFQLVECRSLKLDPRSMAGHLGLHVRQVEDALSRLLRLGIIRQDARGKLAVACEFIATTDQVPSDAIKSFHRQILEKALCAISNQTVERRNFSANVFAIDRSKIPAAKQMMKRFRRRFVKDVSDDGNKDSVYCLTMQFFELTRSGGTI